MITFTHDRARKCLDQAKALEVIIKALSDGATFVHATGLDTRILLNWRGIEGLEFEGSAELMKPLLKAARVHSVLHGSLRNSNALPEKIGQLRLSGVTEDVINDALKHLTEATLYPLLVLLTFGIEPTLELVGYYRTAGQEEFFTLVALAYETKLSVEEVMGQLVLD